MKRFLIVIPSVLKNRFANGLYYPLGQFQCFYWISSASFIISLHSLTEDTRKQQDDIVKKQIIPASIIFFKSVFIYFFLMRNVLVPKFMKKAPKHPVTIPIKIGISIYDNKA